MKSSLRESPQRHVPSENLRSISAEYPRISPTVGVDVEEVPIDDIHLDDDRPIEEPSLPKRPSSLRDIHGRFTSGTYSISPPPPSRTDFEFVDFQAIPDEGMVEVVAQEPTAYRGRLPQTTPAKQERPIKPLAHKEKPPQINLAEQRYVIAMRQAQEIAEGFPGLIIDRDARKKRGDDASSRAYYLEEELRDLKQDRERLAIARRETGARSKSSGSKNTHFLSGLDRDINEDSEKLRKTTDEITLYNAFPDARSEIIYRIDKLEALKAAPPSEKSTPNGDTQKNIDEKIRQLTRLSELLRGAEGYEHPAEAPKERPHIRTDAQEPAPAKPVESPSYTKAHLQAEEKRREKDALRKVSIEFYENQLKTKRAELQKLADLLAEKYGQFVEIPWQSGSKQKKSIMKESIASSIFTGVRNLFRGREVARLLKEFEEKTEDYATLEDALRAVDTFQ